MKRTTPRPAPKASKYKNFIRISPRWEAEWLDRAPWISYEKFLQKDLVGIVEHFHRDLRLKASYRPTIIGQHEGLRCTLANLLQSILLGLPLRVSKDTAGGKRKEHWPYWAIPNIMVPIYNALQHQGWVTERLGYRTKSGKGKVTRLIPTVMMAEFFKEHKLGWWAIETNLFKDRELRMKVPYLGEWTELDRSPHNELSREARTHLVKYNEEGKSHVIKVNLTSWNQGEIQNKLSNGGEQDREIGQKEELEWTGTGTSPDLPPDTSRVKLYDLEDLQVYQINMKQRYATDLYRIFYKHLGFGGRFYGADHINLPKTLRKSLTIDGEPTVELDYRAMHLALLHALDGAQLEGDPYDIPGIPRDVVKTAVLVLINAENRTSAIRGLNYAVYRQELTLPPGLRTNELVDRIMQRFPTLRFCCPGMWQILQRFESVIMARIIAGLLCGGVLCLPIHDGLIVQRKHEDLARKMMAYCYSETMRGWFGRPFTIEVK